MQCSSSHTLHQVHQANNSSKLLLIDQFMAAVMKAYHHKFYFVLNWIQFESRVKLKGNFNSNRVSQMLQDFGEWKVFRFICPGICIKKRKEREFKRYLLCALIHKKRRNIVLKQPYWHEQSQRSRMACNECETLCKKCLWDWNRRGRKEQYVEITIKWANLHISFEILRHPYKTQHQIFIRCVWTWWDILFMWKFTRLICFATKA